MKNASPCYRCKCEVWIPDALYDAAQHGRGKVEFFCGYGHGQVFSEGESEETKLRRERDRLMQRLAEKDDAIAYQRGRVEQLDKRLSATRGVVTRIKNRIGHGVCPCCNRTFGDLSKHMATKHPSYAAEAAE